MALKGIMDIKGIMENAVKKVKKVRMGQMELQELPDQLAQLEH